MAKQLADPSLKLLAETGEGADMKLLWSILSHVNFWLWNSLFLLTFYLGLLPIVGIPILEATALGQIPVQFTISFIALLLIPPACMALGIKLIKRPLELTRFFSGVEAPLILLCIVRLWVLRELTPASGLILTTIFLSIVAFAVDIFSGDRKPRQAVAIARTILATLMIVVGGYASTILLIYAIPIAVQFIAGFLSFQWVRWLADSLRYSGPQGLFYGFFGLILFGFSVIQFMATPSILTVFYLQSGWRRLGAFAQQWGNQRAIALALTTLIFWGGSLLALHGQPQTQAFALLEKPATTNAAKQALLAQSEPIRQGLLNAYLSSYRYLSPVEDNTHIRDLYRSAFRGLPEGFHNGAQVVYNTLLAPFLYNGSASDDQKAADLYGEFFDKPIQKGEPDAIKRALSSTGNRDSAKAGLLNHGDRKVWLKQQDITVQEHGDWADVQLYERYDNVTNDVQEVFYSFSLPESAVITGLWLGDTPDLSKRYVFQVSPRGAAQQVYNNQVQRVNPIDPALLEQVGPRHYRLRAFPIPVKVPGWINRDRLNTPANTNPDNRPTEMNLWLTYKVMRSPEGWALPQLGEKRNIFWDKKTHHTVNGQASGSQPDDQWLPAAIPALSSGQPNVHQLTLNNQQITAQPLKPSDYTLPRNQRYAVVLDTSRSMGTQQQAIAQTLDWLKRNGFADQQLSNNEADLYLTSTTGTPPQRLDTLTQFQLKTQPFYGNLQLKDLLIQFTQLRRDTNYAGVILLTDGDTYEIAKDSGTIPAPGSPLWLVHLGKLPPAYDDTTLKTLQDSGGGVSTQLSEVLQRAATQAKLGPNTIAISDGYAWSVTPSPAATPAPEAAANKATDKATATAATPAKAAQAKPSQPTVAKPVDPNPFNPLAARQLINALSKMISDGQVAQLDAVHAIAKEHRIVTPYSSMIVLVNDDQRRQLAEAEKSADRFDREVETGQETLEKPFNAMATSTPEPSVIGAILGAGLLILVWRTGTSTSKRHF